MLRSSGDRSPALETVVVARGPCRTGRWSWDTFVGRATEEGRGEVDRRRRRGRPRDPSDILFTSGTTGRPKGVVQTHGRTLCVATDWLEMTGLCAEDRYLMVNPYFHMFGLKAGILACVAAGATMYPQAVFDVDRVLRPGGARADHGAPRGTDDLPVAPRPPRVGPVRPVVAAGGRHRCRRHTGRAHPADRTTSCRSRRSSAGTADRRRDGDRHVTRRRGRGHRHYRRSPPAGFRGPHRRRSRRRRPDRGAWRGRRPQWQCHVPLPRRPRGHRRGPVPRRLAAHRRYRHPGRAGQPADRRPGQGHVHRGRLQRLSGRDRESSPAPPRHPAGGRDRGPRRPPGGGGHGFRRAGPGSVVRGADHRVGPGGDGQLQGAAVRGVRRRTSLNATGKVEKDRPAGAGGPAPLAGVAA